MPKSVYHNRRNLSTRTPAPARQKLAYRAGERDGRAWYLFDGGVDVRQCLDVALVDFAKWLGQPARTAKVPSNAQGAYDLPDTIGSVRIFRVPHYQGTAACLVLEAFDG